MCKFNIQRFGLLLLALFGVVMLSGCANMGPSPVARTYYQDRDCRIYYINGFGEREYQWGGAMHREADYKYPIVNNPRNPDANYVDSYGNQIFRERVCD